MNPECKTCSDKGWIPYRKHSGRVIPCPECRQITPTTQQTAQATI